MQLVRFRGEYLIFELNKPEHPEVAIPLGTSSLAWVLSPPLNSPADAPRDDVLYVQGPSPIKVGWLKTKRSLASFEPAEKEAYLMGWGVPSMGWAIDGSLTRLAVVSAGFGEDEVWSSRGKAELWELQCLRGSVCTAPIRWVFRTRRSLLTGRWHSVAQAEIRASTPAGRATSGECRTPNR
jgi:hypothetical protein